MVEFRQYNCIFFSLSGEYPQHKFEVHSTISAPAAFITTVMSFHKLRHTPLLTTWVCSPLSRPPDLLHNSFEYIVLRVSFVNFLPLFFLISSLILLQPILLVVWNAKISESLLSSTAFILPY